MIKYIFLFFIQLSFLNFAQLFGPKISVQSPEHNFGDIIQGEEVSHKFVIFNRGGDILKIIDIKAPCGCTVAQPNKKELKPGESTTLKVTFNSTGRIGPQRKNVFVITNDSEKRETELVIRCNIVLPKINKTSGALLYFPETQHNFGKLKEGAIVTHSFKFVNTGDADLEIKNINTGCGCAVGEISSNKLKPGETGTLTIELNTKNRVGKMSRTITVTSNDREQQNRYLLIFAEVVK